MFFFTGQTPDFLLIPTLGFGDIGGSCDCGCTSAAGFRIFLAWAGFEIGFGFFRTPKTPHP